MSSYYQCKRDFVIGGVDLSVCLQSNLKSYRRIFINVSGHVDNDTKNRCFICDGDLDHRLNMINIALIEGVGPR